MAINMPHSLRFTMMPRSYALPIITTNLIFEYLHESVFKVEKKLPIKRWNSKSSLEEPLQSEARPPAEFN